MKRICPLMIMLLLLSSMTQAATYYVATTGNDNNPGTQAQPFRNISKGIAVAAANGDTILIANGTYNEHNLDFVAKNLVLQSQNNNPATCILNCQQAGRGIRFAGGQDATSVVSGLTIQNGISLAAGTDAGGLLIQNASPTITNCVFSANSNNGRNNFASAVEVNGGNPTFTGCAFQNNIGVAIRTETNVNSTMTNCTFTGNSASGQFGGAISHSGSGSALVLKGCTFTNNTAGYGGAISHGGDAALIADRCVFTGNYADQNDGYGGGGVRTGFGGVTLTNCLFVNNNCAKDTSNGNPIVNANSLCMRNTGSGKIVNCTFSGTWTQQPQNTNIALLGVNVDVVNCIIWGGDSDVPWADVYKAYGGTATVTYSNSTFGYPGTGNISANPQFVNVGGGNYRLQSISPCLNTGSAAAPSLPATDMDGGPRLIGSAPDMGAYEFWNSASGAWFVDKTLGNDTTGNGSPAAPYKTVVKAINSASNGHQIYIKQGNYNTDKPRITKSLRLFNWTETGLSRIGQP